MHRMTFNDSNESYGDQDVMDVDAAATQNTGSSSSGGANILKKPKVEDEVGLEYYSVISTR